MRTCAVGLPGAVLVCVFLQGIYRTDGDHRLDHYTVRGDADDRTDQLGREVCPNASTASAGTLTKVGAALGSTAVDQPADEVVPSAKQQWHGDHKARNLADSEPSKNSDDD